MTQHASSNQTALSEAVKEGRLRFTKAHPESAASHQTAARYLPGGNTRSVIFTAPFPVRLVKGEGTNLWTADGHKLIDFLNEYTAGLAGHSNQTVKAAISAALDRGMSLGGHNGDEIELARLITQRFPSIDSVRFTNSGTEASLMAIAAASAFTKRKKIVAFEGGYHGGVLNFPLAAAPTNVPYPVALLPFNDVEAVVRLFETEGDQISAVIVEPMMGSGGGILADPAFLACLRSETEKAGALLIFDEIQTSRLAPHGLQGKYKVFPDLTTLGKYICGGMSFGAFGGRHDIMAQFNPLQSGALSHAGTFNNNTLSMAAGVAMMTHVFTEAECIRVNKVGDDLRESLAGYARDMKLPVCFTGSGSILSLHFLATFPHDYRGTLSANALLKELFWMDMLEAGFWIARRGMMSISLPHSPAEIASVREAIIAFLQRREALLDA
jgi:glutamate-1-semialdehyde 2,1-aminomutase